LNKSWEFLPIVLGNGSKCFSEPASETVAYMNADNLTNKEIVRIENLYKEKLGTKAEGLNSN
jgi:hypothetical protein